MDREKPLISVVVPVYNVEPCLDKCLDSIERQTWQKLEIIIVDDASTDGGGRICDAHADRDSRIETVHFPVNRGLSAARNEGILRAKGEYLTFVDSDDYVEPELLERLWLSLEESGAQIGICGVDGVFSGGISGEDVWTADPLTEDVSDKAISARLLSRKQIVHCMARRSPFLWNAWGKLYPAELVKRHPFDGRALCCEDLVFFYQILGHVERAGYVKERLYHYVYREKSLINSGVDEKRCTVLSALDHICKDAAARFPDTASGFEQIALDAGARLAMEAVEGGVTGKALVRYLKRFRNHTRRHFRAEALKLCPDKKSAAAQILLWAGWEAFWGAALIFKAVKGVRKLRNGG